MRWLLTVSTDVDLDALTRDLANLDAEMSADDPVPLGQGEQAVGATGPHDLPQRISDAGLPVMKVNPDSDMTLY
jgi:hypothetical protein